MRSIVTTARTASVLAVIAFALTSPLAAQRGDGVPPRFHAGLSATVAQPLGEFHDYVGVGGGLSAFFRVNMDPAGIVSLRFRGGFVNYGNETKRVCLSQTVGCRIEVDLTTSNNIFLLGVGPELAVPIGPVRLYGNGGVGLGYFSTDSQVSGSTGDEPFASTQNYGDGGFAWNAGGGMEVEIAQAREMPISLDLGLSYQRNGLRDYLTEGGISERPDGSLELDVRRSEANLLLWTLGVSVGFRP
jgi:opacity protein-like surface antigen